jgi:hypothetical protein
VLGFSQCMGSSKSSCSKEERETENREGREIAGGRIERVERSVEMFLNEESTWCVSMRCRDK